MEFEIGDRVVMEYPRFSDELADLVVGCTGTIIAFDDFGRAGVYWDDNVWGHTLDGRCPDNHGWWTNVRSLNLVETNHIEPATQDELFSFLGI